MQSYLSPNGIKIYNVILRHIDKNNWSMSIDDYELSMLANAFDTYEKCALTVQTLGMTQEAKGGFLTARPEVGIMEKTYQIILKHSAKFGLNPGDRKKIFKVIDQKRRKKTFDTDHTNYNALFIEWWNAQEERGEVNMNYLEAFRKYYRQHNQEPATLLDLI